MTIFIKTDLQFLAAQWEAAKLEEKEATTRRRTIEDQIVQAMALPESDGSQRST